MRGMVEMSRESRFHEEHGGDEQDGRGRFHEEHY